jgi:hypothetical protein
VAVECAREGEAVRIRLCVWSSILSCERRRGAVPADDARQGLERRRGGRRRCGWGSQAVGVRAPSAGVQLDRLQPAACGWERRRQGWCGHESGGSELELEITFRGLIRFFCGLFYVCPSCCFLFPLHTWCFIHNHLPSLPLATSLSHFMSAFIFLLVGFLVDRVVLIFPLISILHWNSLLAPVHFCLLFCLARPALGS